MNEKAIIRGLAITIAIPVGGFCGFLVADSLCRLLLGGGNAHGDVADVLGSDALAVLVGAFVLPFSVWFFTRRARN